MFLAAEPSQGAGTRQARLCDLPNQPGLGKIRTFFMMELLERIIGFAAVDGTWLDRMTAVVDAIDAWVWGWPLIGTLLATGLLYTLWLKFLPIRFLLHGFRHMFRREHGAEGEVSNFASLCTALATTIGTGNIVGVATAIGTGGPGALFWMEVAAILGMATKYAEGLLAIFYREVAGNGRVIGGPFQYIEKGLGPRWKPLAVAFSVFGIVTGLFGVGTFVQVNGITSAVLRVFDPGFNPADPHTGIALFGTTYSQYAMIAGAMVTVAVAAVIVGGLKRISVVASVIVPFMAVFYMLTCIFLIARHIDALPGACLDIVRGAFNPAAVGGGAIGTFFVALQRGVSRGIFSNEAGLGSAPIASAVAQTNEPVQQGLISMTGVFLDTTVVCTLTGLAIVMMGTWKPELGLQGVDITLAAFSQGLPFGGRTAEIVLMVSLVFFAYTTTLGWTFYSEKCLDYLVGTDRHWPVKVMRGLFIATIAVGPYLTVSLVWGIADICCGLMAFPNLVALVVLSPVVVRCTREYFSREPQSQ